MRSPKLLASISIIVAAVLCAPQISLAQYSINTIAGGGPNNLPALQASIGYPESIAFDSAGNAYIANSYPYANQIVEVSPTGTLTVVAGNGTLGYSGDGGPATSAALNQPEGVFVDASGNIFIADTENSVIREVVASTGDIKTVVGTNYDASDGSACQYADGPALSAYLCLPYSIFVDVSNNIFIADLGNSVIRQLVASSGNVQTVAGNYSAGPGYSGDGPATREQLDLPDAVFVDAAGNIFISDTFNNLVRVVNPSTQAVVIANVTIPAGNIGTVAGIQYDSAGGSACQLSANGTAISEYLCEPAGLFVDSSDDIYVADYYNFAIREISAAGSISTVAGTLPTASNPFTNCSNYLTTGCGNGGPATSAELNYPSGVTLDGSGDTFIADTSDFVVRVVTGGNIQAFAGNGFPAYSGDTYPATNAELNNPGSVAFDASGNLYIADTSNNVIRVYNPGASPVTIFGVTIQPGDIGTVAGTGTPGYAGDSGPPNAAQLSFPQGVFVDNLGDIFIADTANSVIREAIVATGKIQTVAGNGTVCSISTNPNCGDGNPAISAELSSPAGVFVDLAGNIFIADTDDYVIREVAASNGYIKAVAGSYADCNPSTAACGDTGPAIDAQLSFPGAVFVDLSDNIYIADSSDNRIREVANSTGYINTVAGTGAGGYSGDGGAAISAELDNPSGVFVDSSGDIFIADSDNAAIREVVASSGFIQTIAGIPSSNGFPTPGFSGDGGPATSAELNAPSGIFGNSAGKLFIADTNNSRIRELAPAQLSVSVAPVTATVVIDALQQFTATVTGNPNTSVNWFVNSIAGGNSTVGTISNSGLYTAPASVPSGGFVTISAVSQVDNTTSGSAQATIANPSGTITVTVSTNPPVTEVYTGTVQPFIATVTGTSNTAVNWYAEGAQGGDATYGTIDTSGNYTAPTNVPSPSTIVVEAVSQADSTAIGTESVLIVAAPSGPQGAPQTISPGQSATYSLSLNQGTGSPQYPITLACLQSSLPAGASCNFSPATITPSTTQAVPFMLTVTVPASSSSLRRPSRPWHASPIEVAFLPLVGFLLLGGRRRNQRRRSLWLTFLCVSLLMLVACGGGGGSTTPIGQSYTIKVQGTTTAQPNPVTITTASLTVE